MRRFLLILPILLMGCAKEDQSQAAATAVVQKKNVPFEIVEASYGLSCKNYEVVAPASNTVIAGNATSVVVAECKRTSPIGDTCIYTVNVGGMGDPAPICAKDFEVKWRCGTQDHSAHLDGESNGKSVTISCE